MSGTVAKMWNGESARVPVMMSDYLTWRSNDFELGLATQLKRFVNPSYNQTVKRIKLLLIKESSQSMSDILIIKKEWATPWDEDRLAWVADHALKKREKNPPYQLLLFT